MRDNYRRRRTNQTTPDLLEEVAERMRNGNDWGEGHNGLEAVQIAVRNLGQLRQSNDWGEGHNGLEALLKFLFVVEIILSFILGYLTGTRFP